MHPLTLYDYFIILKINLSILSITDRPFRCITTRQCG